MTDWGVSVHAPETVRAPDEATALKRAAKQTTFSVVEIVEPPPPPPDPVPKGTFYRGDDMTLSNAEAIIPIWGQHSVEGGAGEIQWRTDGPVIDGVQHKCRRLIKESNSRRNEIGQVNGDTGFVFEVGGEYVTRAWYRVPTNLAWDRAPDHQGAIMQMKHSGRVAYGGFGGDPASPAPPLGLKQTGSVGDGRIVFGQRSGSGDLNELWERAIPHLTWFEVVYHVRYSLTDGFANIYFRFEGGTPELVLKFDGPTVKENEQGRPMHSTYRTGCYDESNLDRFVDAGPVRVERRG